MNEFYLKQLIRNKLIGKEFQPLMVKVSSFDEYNTFIRVANIKKCYLDPTFKVVNLYTTSKTSGEITWTFLKIYTKIEGKYYEILFHKSNNASSATYEDFQYFTYDDYEVMHINNYLKDYDECVAADNAGAKDSCVNNNLYKTIPVEAPKYDNNSKDFEDYLPDGAALKPWWKDVIDTEALQGHRMSKEETAAIAWEEEARIAETINKLEKDLGVFGIAIKDVANNYRPYCDILKDCTDKFKELEEDTKAQDDIMSHIKTPEDIVPYIKSIEAINIQNTNGTVVAMEYVPGSFSIEKTTDNLAYSTDPDQQVWISSRSVTQEIKTFSFEIDCDFGTPTKWANLEVLCEVTDDDYYWITFKPSAINSSLEKERYYPGRTKITGHWQSMEIRKVEQVIETIDNITTGFIYNDFIAATTHIHNIQSLVINNKDKIFTINLNDIKEYVTSPKEIWKITLNIKDEKEEIDTIEILLDDDYCDVHSELTPTGSSITGHFKEVKKYNLRKTIYNQLKDITAEDYEAYCKNKSEIFKIIEDTVTKEISTTETKEENNMFDNIFGKYDFGEVKDKNIAYSPYGIALRDSAGDYVVYNVDGSVATNIGKDMIFDVPMLKLPATYEDIKSGDIIVHFAIGNSAYVIVKEKTENGIVVIDPGDKTIKTLVPEKNIFGFEFYVKVMPPFNMDAVKPTKDNPFGNLMLPMMMSRNSNDDMFKYLMLMQMGGQTEFNPMLFMLMGKDNENSNDSFFKYMMFSQMGNFNIGNSNTTIEK